MEINAIVPEVESGENISLASIVFGVLAGIILYSLYMDRTGGVEL